MTANLFALNSFKTELLLISLSKQLAKIHNSSLNTTHSARNLGFIFSRSRTLARAVVKAPKFSHTTPILRSLRWLKITERIEYKLLSLTYKVLTTNHLHNLHNLIAALAVHLWSHSLVHPHHLLYE